MRTSRGRCWIYFATLAVIAATCLWSDAEAAPLRSSSTTHHVDKRGIHFYQDKGYGDGSMKHFFIMLKVMLAIFGKNWWHSPVLPLALTKLVYLFAKAENFINNFKPLHVLYTNIKCQSHCGKRSLQNKIKQNGKNSTKYLFKAILRFVWWELLLDCRHLEESLASLFLVHLSSTMPWRMLVACTIGWTSMLWSRVLTVVILKWENKHVCLHENINKIQSLVHMVLVHSMVAWQHLARKLKMGKKSLTFSSQF